MVIKLVDDSECKRSYKSSNIYKVRVSKDGHNFFYIIVKDVKIINTKPTDEELKCAKPISYNDTNICPICRDENRITDRSILYPKNVLHDTDETGNKTDKRVCLRHGKNRYERYNPNSSQQTIKSLRLTDAVFKEDTNGIYRVRLKDSDDDMLNYLKGFEKQYGRPPSHNDFANNPYYPHYATYKKRFGSWNNALKLVGLDVDSMVRKGVVTSEYQKGRLSEIIIIDQFIDKPIDLAGISSNSPFDGICPNGKTYDVKSSGLKSKDGGLYWDWNTRNKYKEEIEIYYLLAFNENWTKLEHAWRITSDMINTSAFYIGLRDTTKGHYTFNIDNMKKYEITEKIREILTKKEDVK